MGSDPLERIQVAAAAERLRGVVKETPLVPFECADERVELRLKLECLQETGAFKARGAWTQIAQLSAEQKAAGVVTTSSGNHGKALAWAAQRAGVRATIVMPADAYPNKIQACRDFGAEVVLGSTRAEAERLCRERVDAGATLVHPYDAENTIQGAGTVGLEIAREWPEVEMVVVQVGGGGLLAGCALAIRQTLGRRVLILGVEPEGAPSMKLSLERGRAVTLERITTKVQGLCPPYSGALNTEICGLLVDQVITLEDQAIFAAQRELVLRGGWDVEPAGAAACALVLAGRLPKLALIGRSREHRLRVACVVSGGNPDPAQIAALRRQPE
ncbi:MAG: pyridoxal-phosphate dependent enzyme [Planctomycetes bacterium]|nr:pyridoxal-phosphate dependent enzyme [Planctomycetota bacterium]